MMHKQNRSVLICFIGTVRAVELTSQKLKENLIEPLNADIAFCLTSLSDEDKNSLGDFDDCNIIDTFFYKDTDHQYENTFKQASNTLDVSEKDRWQEYLKIEGNWLGGMAGRRGSGMHLTYNYYQLSTRLEKLKSNGMYYERFVITRLDHMWLASHPPFTSSEGPRLP